MTALSTPGPWTLSEPRDEEKEWPVWAMQAPPGAKMPALCFGPDAEWNAKLIAAAPALAAALEAIIGDKSWAPVDQETDALIADACDALRAAGRLP